MSVGSELLAATLSTDATCGTVYGAIFVVSDEVS